MALTLATNGHADPKDDNARIAAVPVVLATRCVDVLRGAGACASAPVVTWPLQSTSDFIGCALSAWHLVTWRASCVPMQIL